MELEGFADYSEILRAGVYALCWQGRVVYVGQSKRMLSRVCTHQNLYNRNKKVTFVPDWMPVKGIRFDEVHIRPCRVEELDELEREMIALYRPRHNIRLMPAVTIGAMVQALTKAEPGVLRRI